MVACLRFLVGLTAILTFASIGQGREPQPTATAADKAPFHLYTRATAATWPTLKKLVKDGDLVWGRQVPGISAAVQALTVPSLEVLMQRLKTEKLSDYAAINLDGEYRDMKLALEDVTKIRELVEKLNAQRKREKGPAPLKFTAFFHMRIIEAVPEIVRYPDVVLVGKSYWDANNIKAAGNRDRRTATKYVKLIRDAGREPGILLGSPEKALHDAAGILKTIEVCLTPEAKGGLGVTIIGFYYERDKVDTLAEVLGKAR